MHRSGNLSNKKEVLLIAFLKFIKIWYPVRGSIYTVSCESGNFFVA
jgi:hypothetical protein